jgi:hypothetical protein
VSQFEPVSKVSAVGHGDNIKVLSQAWGERVTATDRYDSAGSSVQPAGLWSTAPYIDPAIQRAAREAKEAQAEAERNETFARQVEALGQDPTTAVRRGCKRQGCRNLARKDSDTCRWHPEG